jgi:uncharacterized protein YutD
LSFPDGNIDVFKLNLANEESVIKNKQRYIKELCNYGYIVPNEVIQKIITEQEFMDELKRRK